MNSYKLRSLIWSMPTFIGYCECFVDGDVTFLDMFICVNSVKPGLWPWHWNWGFGYTSFITNTCPSIFLCKVPVFLRGYDLEKATHWHVTVIWSETKRIMLFQKRRNSLKDETYRTSLSRYLDSRETNCAIGKNPTPSL